MSLRYSIEELIYRIYKQEKDNIPYPLLKHVINHKGGWTGMSIYLAFRQFQFEMKRKQAVKIGLNYLIPFLLVSFIIVIGIIDKRNFLFGFSQELAAEITFIFLVLYILPQYLDKSRKFNLQIDVRFYRIWDNDKKREYAITIKNTGKVVFKKEEAAWEIFIPFDLTTQKGLVINVGKIEETYELTQKMWKIIGLNESPIFLEQTIEIGRFIVDGNKYSLEKNPDTKIYYSIRSIYGNLPEIENVSQVLLGAGVEYKNYPRVGEIEIS